jgi:hypothetical protein
MCAAKQGNLMCVLRRLNRFSFFYDPSGCMKYVRFLVLWTPILLEWNYVLDLLAGAQRVANQVHYKEICKVRIIMSI